MHYKLNGVVVSFGSSDFGAIVDEETLTLMIEVVILAIFAMNHDRDLGHKFMLRSDFCTRRAKIGAACLGLIISFGDKVATKSYISAVKTATRVRYPAMRICRILIFVV